jgi:hypothetical protein
MPAAFDGCACSTEPQLEPGNDARGLDEHQFADYAYFINLVSHPVPVKNCHCKTMRRDEERVEIKCSRRPSAHHLGLSALVRGNGAGVCLPSDLPLKAANA